ncbi:MAG: SDR family oxidoreductase [Actinobacteria bacterium]|nr:SDR family oxidoreductase [Actinomycetota bacterium]
MGAACSLRLARDGMRVVLVDRQEGVLADLEQRLRDEDLDAISVTADITQVEDVQRCVDRALASYESVDALVHAAGIVGDPARVMTLTPMGHSPPASPEEIEAAESQVATELEPRPDLSHEQWVDLLTDAALAAAGPGYAFDEDRTRALWRGALDQGWSPAGALRQRAAFYFSERASAETIAETLIPVLVLQGTADAGFEWAEDFSRRLPEARFVALEAWATSSLRPLPRSSPQRSPNTARAPVRTLGR